MMYKVGTDFCPHMKLKVFKKCAKVAIYSTQRLNAAIELKSLVTRQYTHLQHAHKRRMHISTAFFKDFKLMTSSTFETPYIGLVLLLLAHLHIV